MKEGGGSDVKCAYEGNGRKNREFGGEVTVSSFLYNVRFDLPAHHFGKEEGPQRSLQSDPVASLELATCEPVFFKRKQILCCQRLTFT